MNAAHMIPGDRTTPRLPLRPELRAVAKVGATGCCPVFSRIGGRFPVRDGSVSLGDAVKMLVAGEG